MAKIFTCNKCKRLVCQDTIRSKEGLCKRCSKLTIQELKIKFGEVKIENSQD